MKHITVSLWLGGMLLFNAFAVQAEQEQVCEEWASKAGSYMLFRQMNTPIHEAIQNAMGNVTRGLLLSAYQEPVQDTNEGKQKAIDDFKKQTYDGCISQQE
ncbi:hypothetical protein [Methylophaga muralis]|uniref:Uncharacterized protein n=1 Tax=Methylophaga muralis TaxID=291169 RepID=A0A1E3GV67_9GAMM|nr:hypothetical protein [Methylophaga muralis]ODN67446.1 hypothetical protein A9E74_00790 [Methylophaga muralis]